MHKLFLLLPLGLIFLSCNLFEKEKVRFDEATFNRERAAWEVQGLRDYQFTHKYSDGGGRLGPVRVTVKNGAVSDTEMLNEWMLANWSPSQWRLELFDHTISGIFDLIASYYATAQEEVKKEGTLSASIDVTYNAQYHYPEHVDYAPAISPGNWDGYSSVLRDITDFSR